ncbi:hypothetical protein K3495_g5180 [Podosphaera aphanis]|nr:hypothetical protein K3495_g5180 [Podosphaera aphanis]
MSDFSRKGFAEQAQNKVTPQSKKPTSSIISENVSGAGDKFASTIQPDSKKSGTQEAFDKVRGKNESQDKESSYLESAANKLSSAADTVTGKTKDAEKSTTCNDSSCYKK